MHIEDVPDLVWRAVVNDGLTYHEAEVGDFMGTGGLRFTLEHRPTNNLRGPWIVLVETRGDYPGWGETERYYHVLECAKREASALACVLRNAHDESRRRI